MSSISREVKQCILNEKITDLIKQFFEKNPVSQFNIRSMTRCFPEDDIYSYLMKLEDESIIIRSKIEINEKPVTHWQLNRNRKTLPISDTKSYGSSSTNYNGNGGERNQFKKYIPRDENGMKSNSTGNSNIQMTTNEIVENGKCKLPPRRLIARQESNKSTVKSTDSDETDFQVGPEITKSRNDRLNSETFRPQSDSLSKENSVKPKSNLVFIEKRPPTGKGPKPGTYNNNSKKSTKSGSDTISKEIVTAIEKNPVSSLYEFAQQKGITCQIEMQEMTGPSHKPKISMLVSLGGYKFDSVVAPNKKEGKRLAAELAIKKLISEGYFSQNISKILNESTAKKDAMQVHEHVNVSNAATAVVDKIASLVCNELTVLLRDLSYDKRNSLAGRIIISGIVMQDEKHDTFRVVALATGNRCITGDKISLQGKVVNDCHAEVVTRRSFVLFLYQQLSAHLTSNDESLNIFEDCQETSSLSMLRRFKVKDHIKFHLYISTAPCGDSALFCNRDNDFSKLESEFISSDEHKPTYEHPVQGLLRSKIEGGEGTIPVMNTNTTFQVQSLDGILRGERLKTMSCSDKIARWNYLGIQGSLLTQFIEPIFLSSVSLGGLYDAGHLCRALCCRLDQSKSTRSQRRVNHPHLGFVHTGSLQKNVDKRSQFSVNWCHGHKLEIIDGVSGQLTGPEKQITCSRVAKASLFHQYLKLFRAAGYNPFVNRYSYNEAKLLSTDYNQSKERLFELFHKLEYGSWIRKPSEQNDFKDTLYN